MLQTLTCCLMLCGQTFPVVDDEEVTDILKSNRTFFYTSQTLPPAYQLGGGVHNVHYNISADPREQRTGPGNGFEFPWKEPGGMHSQSRSKVKGIKALHLPSNGSGGMHPVVYWRQGVRTGGRTHNVYRWIFPVNTEILECLFIADATGKYYPFELRRRTRFKDSWGAAVYAPVKDQSDLPAGMKLIKRTSTIADGKHVRKAFMTKATHYALPNLPASVVREILSKPFVEVTGERFPLTSSQPFSIVPDKYFGAFTGSDEDSCGDCHRDTLKSVDIFDQQRDWYGLIRGDDGIFSFHPFSNASISSNGANRPVRINTVMLARGVVAKYNPGIHPSSVYSQRASNANRN